MKKTNKKKVAEFDLERIRIFMAMSAEKKIQQLIDLNQFLAGAPAKTKRLWKIRRQLSL